MVVEADAVVWVLKLLLAAFGPLLYFVALFRLLDALRADEVIAGVDPEVEFDTGSISVVAPITRESSGGTGSTCPSCGADNMADASYCQQCLRDLQ